MASLKDKNIILTGAGGGIGQEVTALLLDAGANVIATDYSTKALDVLKGIRTGAGRLILQKLDVTNDKDWDKVIEKALSHDAPNSGKLDAVINNAGVLKTGWIKDITADDIDFHFSVNTKGVILGSHKAAKVMIEQKSGHIVNIASLAGVAPIPGISLYSASKFAARGFTLALASELEPHGVKATVVCPDAVQTPMLDIQKDKEEAALTFSGSVLTASDIAQVIVGALNRDEVEILEPWTRGWMAKLANLTPAISNLLMNTLRNQGRKKQASYK